MFKSQVKTVFYPLQNDPGGLDSYAVENDISYEEEPEEEDFFISENMLNDFRSHQLNHLKTTLEPTEIPRLKIFS